MTSGPDVSNRKPILMSPSICHRYTLDVHRTRGKLVFYKPFRPKSKSNAVYSMFHTNRERERTNVLHDRVFPLDSNPKDT